MSFIEIGENMGIEFTYFQPLYGAQNSFIYLLTAIVFLLAVISLIKGHFDVLNPSFIYSICLAGCCFLAALYAKKWDMPMHFNSAIIIIIMSILLLLGGSLADYCCHQYTAISLKKQKSQQGFFISKSLWVVFMMILVYLGYLNYTDILSAASEITNETEFKKILLPVINSLNHHEIELSRWNAYRTRFATIMAYLSTMAIWLNLTAHQYKEALKWGCFILAYIPFIIFTGGRQQFMYLIMFALVSFFLVHRKSYNKSSLANEFVIIGIAVAVFLFCFLGAGIFNGKIGSDSGFLQILVHYAGTNISAFDVYVNEMIIPDTQYIGASTFDNIYGFLYARGLDVPPFIQYITLFTAFGPVTTNVYTAFYRYINDFGYFGCALVIFLIGFFYTFLYRQLYHHGLKNWMILIYASIIYPVFLMGREERFFNEILTTSKISFIVGLLILYKFFELLNERRSNVK